MQHFFRLGLAAAYLLFPLRVLRGQDLAPCAYIITPLHSNAVGATSLNGVENPVTRQKNSRLGGTAAIPINKHLALKFSYSNGTYIQFGGNCQNVSVAWQYSWLGRPN